MAVVKKKKKLQAYRSGETWAVKYRPETLNDMVGQANAVATIRGMLKSRSLANALLITGPTGTGKTTLARIICREVNGENWLESVTEINASDQRGIDAMREVSRLAGFMPSGNIRFIILDECHALTPQAASALLKNLEEAPKHTTFILCTNEPEKLLPTVSGRCMKIPLSYPSVKSTMGLLKSVLEQEGISFGKAEEKILRLVAETTNSQPRDSLSVLQSIATTARGRSEGQKIDIKEVLSAVKRFTTTSADNVAMKVLLSVYAGKPMSALSALYDSEDLNGVAYKMMNLNNFLIAEATGGNTYKSYMRINLKNLLEQKKVKPNVARLIKVHGCLVDIRREMATYAVPESELLLAKIGMTVLQMAKSQ